MLHEDHIQTQYTHYQYKRQDDALEGVGSVLTKSEAEHIKVSEEEHETRTGNEIVGEEGRPSVYRWVFDCIVKFFCYEKIRDDKTWS